MTAWCGAQERHRGSQGAGSPWSGPGQQRTSGEQRGAQGSTGEHWGAQERGVKGSTREQKGAQGNTGEQRGAQGSIVEHRGPGQKWTSGEQRGAQGSTGEHWGAQESTGQQRTSGVCVSTKLYKQRTLFVVITLFVRVVLKFEVFNVSGKQEMFSLLQSSN